MKKLSGQLEQIRIAIRKTRESKNMSQSAIARKIGISQNAYSKLELGYSALTINRLFELAEVLEIDVLDLMAQKKKD